MSNPNLLESTTSIVVAQLSTAAAPLAEVPGFIRSVYETLRALEASEASEPTKPSETVATTTPTEAKKASPAVPIEDSITHDHLVCLEDGKRLRMLKRYLMTQYGLSPEAYRTKWGLPADYPMIAPAVSAQRKGQAINSGLGRKKSRNRKVG